MAANHPWPRHTLSTRSVKLLLSLEKAGFSWDIKHWDTLAFLCYLWSQFIEKEQGLTSQQPHTFETSPRVCWNVGVLLGQHWVHFVKSGPLPGVSAVLSKDGQGSDMLTAASFPGSKRWQGGSSSFRCFWLNLVLFHNKASLMLWCKWAGTGNSTTVQSYLREATNRCDCGFPLVPWGQAWVLCCAWEWFPSLSEAWRAHGQLCPIRSRWKVGR